MFDIENYVMEIMSKSSSRHLARLRGKLKQTEKEKKNVYILISLIFFSFPMY
jgi:hypothetical protein